MNFRDIAAVFANHVNQPVDEAQLESLFRPALRASPQRVRDTYQACLGRLPDAQFANKQYGDFSGAAAHLADCLRCDEFLGGFVKNIMAAYPSAPRRFFVHVPKTGGSSIKVAFDARGKELVWDTAFLAKSGLLGEKSWSWLYRQIGLQHLNPARPIMYAGHMDVGSLLMSPGLVRSHDELFTVIRRPADCVVSALNYAFSIVLNHPNREDALHFGSWIQDAGFKVPRTSADITASMVEATLVSPGLTKEWCRLLVRYLSPNATIPGALRAISMLNMNVIELSSIDQYMLAEHGLTLPRENQSEKFVPSFDALSRRAKAHVLAQICLDDVALYDALRSLMGETGILRPGRDVQLQSAVSPTRWDFVDPNPAAAPMPQRVPPNLDLIPTVGDAGPPQTTVKAPSPTTVIHSRTRQDVTTPWVV